MNSALTKVSNLKVNKASKIALTFASSVFFLYALGQAPIFKNILAGAFSCSGKKQFSILWKIKVPT